MKAWISKNLGGLLIFWKIFGKLIPVFVKLLKGLKVGKVGMAAGSMAAYSYMFTWQFALILIGMLLVHEYGHVYAMKHYGIKVKGVYLIPFMGAAAIGDIGGITFLKESVIALAGPIVGFVFALIPMIIFYITGNPFFAAIAMWGALINLFNLFPVNPLDGGRVTKSIAFSINKTLGMVFMIAMFGLGTFVSIKLGLWLLTFVTFVGALELFFSTLEYQRMKTREAAHRIVKKYKEASSDLSEADKKFLDEGLKVHSKNKDILHLREPMTKKEIGIISLAYTGLICALIAIMYQMAKFEGTQMAMDVLTN